MADRQAEHDDEEVAHIVGHDCQHEQVGECYVDCIQRRMPQLHGAPRLVPATSNAGISFANLQLATCWTVVPSST